MLTCSHLKSTVMPSMKVFEVFEVHTCTAALVPGYSSVRYVCEVVTCLKHESARLSRLYLIRMGRTAEALRNLIFRGISLTLELTTHLAIKTRLSAWRVLVESGV